MFRPIRWAISAVSTIVLLYVFFCVPIGRRTLFEHFRRIAATPAAQDLGHDLGGAGRQAIERAQHDIEHGIAIPDGGSFADPLPPHSEVQDAGHRAEHRRAHRREP